MMGKNGQPISAEADALYAVSLSGQERLVLRTTGRLMLHDISRDGRVLLTSFSNSTNLVSQPPGETKERDLSWLDQGSLSDLSPDGKTMLISPPMAVTSYSARSPRAKAVSGSVRSARQTRRCCRAAIPIQE
jgi:hypothetical protein